MDEERKDPERMAMDRDELQSYAGTYATELLGVAKITVSGDKASMKIAGFPFTMTFFRGKQWSLKFLGFMPDILKNKLFSIERIGNQTILKAHLFGKQYLAGVRVDPVPVSDTWKNRAGMYAVCEPGDSVLLYDRVKLVYEDGFLITKYKIPGIPGMVPGFILLPVSDTEAVIAGLGRNMGQTVRIVSKDGMEMIYFSGSNLKKVQ
jgi:hypothetical protein